MQSIRESGDSGFPAVMKDGLTATAFKELAEAMAREVAIRNATIDQTKKVELRV